MIEHLKSSKRVYEGKIFSVYVEEVTIGDSKKIRTREIIKHHPAVVVLPFHQGQIYLIRQYRRAIDQILIEAPAGKIDTGELPLDAAKRELKEETGFSAKTWVFLGKHYLSPGFCNEAMHFYWAQDLEAGETDFDEDESCELFSIPATAFESFAKTAPIIDAKTRLVYELSKSQWCE